MCSEKQKECYIEGPGKGHKDLGSEVLRVILIEF